MKFKFLWLIGQILWAENERNFCDQLKRVWLKMKRNKKFSKKK